MQHHSKNGLTRTRSAPLGREDDVGHLADLRIMRRPLDLTVDWIGAKSLPDRCFSDMNAREGTCPQPDITST